MSMNVVAVVWCALSAIIAVSFWFSFLQPAWFINTRSMTSFGIFSHCVASDVTHDDVIPSGMSLGAVVGRSWRCEVFGGEFHFGKLPSTLWQAACVLLGAAAALVTVSTPLTVVAICIGPRHVSAVAVVASYLQITSVCLFVGGLLTYPAGLNSDFTRRVCGHSAAAYRSADCSPGWALVLAVTAAALAIFCPFLARHLASTADHRHLVPKSARRGSITRTP